MTQDWVRRIVGEEASRSILDALGDAKDRAVEAAAHLFRQGRLVGDARERDARDRSRTRPRPPARQSRRPAGRPARRGQEPRGPSGRPLGGIDPARPLRPPADGRRPGPKPGDVADRDRDPVRGGVLGRVRQCDLRRRRQGRRVRALAPLALRALGRERKGRRPAVAGRAGLRQVASLPRLACPRRRAQDAPCSAWSGRCSRSTPATPISGTRASSPRSGAGRRSGRAEGRSSVGWQRPPSSTPATTTTSRRRTARSTTTSP